MNIFPCKYQYNLLQLNLGRGGGAQMEEKVKSPSDTSSSQWLGKQTQTLKGPKSQALLLAGRPSLCASFMGGRNQRQLDDAFFERLHFQDLLPTAS